MNCEESLAASDTRCPARDQRLCEAFARVEPGLRRLFALRKVTRCRDEASRCGSLAGRDFPRSGVISRGGTAIPCSHAARATCGPAGVYPRKWVSVTSRSLGHEAAVHGHRVAGHERGCPGAEPHGGRGDLFGRAHAADRLEADELLRAHAPWLCRSATPAPSAHPSASSLPSWKLEFHAPPVLPSIPPVVVAQYELGRRGCENPHLGARSLLGQEHSGRSKEVLFGDRERIGHTRKYYPSKM